MYQAAYLTHMLPGTIASPIHDGTENGPPPLEMGETSR